MKHLYKITSRHGIDLVAADNARQALGAWAAVRDQDCDPAADTAQCEQVPDGAQIATRERETAAWLASMYEHPGLLDTLDRGTVLLHLGGGR